MTFKLKGKPRILPVKLSDVGKDILPITFLSNKTLKKIAYLQEDNGDIYATVLFEDPTVERLYKWVKGHWELIK